MLEEEQLDLVCVITRNDQHSEMSSDCLRAGVNVLVTKPWAANQAEAERMISVAKESGRKVFPWLPARWGCDFRRLKHLRRENAIGNIFIIRRAVASFATRCDWQTESRCAGGYLLNWGPHIVDPAVLLAGGKAKTVFGRMKQVINPGDVEDLFTAIVTMDNGTIVHMEYTVSPAPTPSWVVQGDRGTITVEGQKMTIRKSTPKRPTDPTRFRTMAGTDSSVIEETLEGNPYGDEYEIYKEIAAAVEEERRFAVQAEDALELTRILDAIRTSSSEDRVVHL
jgi:predicted dehydrogenase